MQGNVELTAAFLLCAAANPCPFGWLGSESRACICSGGALERYRTRLSGPILDRIDVQVSVDVPSLAELRRGDRGEASAPIAGRVAAVREREQARLARWGILTNAGPRLGRAAGNLPARLGPWSRCSRDLAKQRPGDDRARAWIGCCGPCAPSRNSMAADRSDPTP